MLVRLFTKCAYFFAIFVFLTSPGIFLKRASEEKGQKIDPEKDKKKVLEIIKF